MPDATLVAGYTVTFEAIDPDTGAAVSGVTITGAALHGVNFVEASDTTPPADEALPLFVPIPLESEG